MLDRHVFRFKCSAINFGNCNVCAKNMCVLGPLLISARVSARLSVTGHDLLTWWPDKLK